MRTTISKLLKTTSNCLNVIAYKVYESPQSKRVKPWFKNDGDKTLRLNYDLDDNSTVFDLGGYKGQWSSDIYSKYCCNIHIFEPVEEYANYIMERFSQNKKIHVYNFGLADRTYESTIYMNDDGSSMFKQSKQENNIKLISAIEFLDKHNINHIDLMKINIEGGEYDLLKHLIEKNYINRIENIQVQFHDIFPEAEERMNSIQKQLEKTHCITYQYPFVWENWKKIRD